MGRRWGRLRGKDTKKSGGSSKAGGSAKKPGESKKSSGKVNLNRASAEELDRAFGIGPATARKIIAYRDDELGGEFHSVHDITHIDGIGEKTAKLIMESATLD